MNNDLTFELQYHDKAHDVYMINGLSVKETDMILNDHSTLPMVLEKHGVTCRKGIADIRHFGGHLLVKVAR